MRVKASKNKFRSYLTQHQLLKKFEKQVKIFEDDPRHPSLHTELLEPKPDGVYSFRIDKKYRVLFILIDDEAEVVGISDHYQ